MLKYKMAVSLGLVLLSSIACAADMKPMPATISVADKAIIPILKTEVTRTVENLAPEKSVEATVFEVSNYGQDILARELSYTGEQSEEIEKQLSQPSFKKGGVIVPTSKIELNKTITQNGKVVSATKRIDAEGVEYKTNQPEPIKRTLQLDQVQKNGSDKKISHLKMTQNDKTTRDITIIGEK